ncbi:MAG: hypothetical protein OXU71_11055 [Gammaproteobacteria bacterium]|nr:hypothetical protein [Gammaproteobacteria bacterium]
MKNGLDAATDSAVNGGNSAVFPKNIANFFAANAVFPAARLVIPTSTGGFSPIRPFFADFPLTT